MSFFFINGKLLIKVQIKEGGWGEREREPFAEK